MIFLIVHDISRLIIIIIRIFFLSYTSLMKNYQELHFHGHKNAQKLLQKI